MGVEDVRLLDRVMESTSSSSPFEESSKSNQHTKGSTPNDKQQQQDPTYCENKTKAFRDFCARAAFPGLRNGNGHMSKSTAAVAPPPPVVNFLRLPPTTHNHARTRTVSSSEWDMDALELHHAIQEITQRLHSCAFAYASCDSFALKNTTATTTKTMTTSERSALDTQVMSFLARTANRIDNLRRQLPTDDGTDNDMTAHRRAVVSMLLQDLRLGVAAVFEQMRALKNRSSLLLQQHLLANPSTVVVAQDVKQQQKKKSNSKTKTGMSSLVDAFEEEEQGLDQEAQSSSRGHIIAEAMESASHVSPQDSYEQHDFRQRYRMDTDEDQGLQNEDNDEEEDGDYFAKELQRWKESGRKKDSSEEGATSELAKESNVSTTTNEAPLTADTFHPRVTMVERGNNDATLLPFETQTPPPPPQPTNLPDYHQNPNDNVQAEHELLTATLQESDLSDIHKMEERMTEITSLLSRFSELISDQTESVQMVHAQTKSTKENLTKGQDMLVDATERNKKSQHRMAKLMLVLSALLLFFNWIIP